MNSDNGLADYLASITPRDGFQSTYRLRITEQMETHSGIAWIGALYLNGRVVAPVEDRGDGGAPFVRFADCDDRDAFATAIADAYSDRELWSAEESFIAWLDHSQNGS